jgi:hypothetical protein
MDHRISEFEGAILVLTKAMGTLEIAEFGIEGLRRLRPLSSHLLAMTMQ